MYAVDMMNSMVGAFMGNSNFNGVDGNDLGKSGLLCCLLSCVFPCIPLFLLRSEARERYGIEVSSIKLVTTQVANRMSELILSLEARDAT